jgi:hypothetical protein
VLDEGQRARLDELRAGLSQGDVIHMYAMATLGAPEATESPSTQAAAEFAEYRVTSVERRLPGGLWAIITQTCDIRRDLDVEPFLQIAPLRESNEVAWADNEHGRASPRRYAYPRIFDEHDLEYPILDIRLVQTVEKAALVAEDVDPQHLRFEPNERFRLSAWLARRYARHAFPDELEEQMLRALRDAICKRIGKQSAAGALLACREQIMVSYGGEGPVDVLFVLNQARVLARTELGSTSEERQKRIPAALDEIMRPVAVSLEKTGSTYTVTWQAAFPNAIPYADVLYRYYPLDVE